MMQPASNFVLRVAALGGAVCLPLAVACAQQTVTQLGLSGGAITDARGIRSNAITLSPGVVLWPTGPVVLSLSGSGSRFNNAEWQLGGTSALSARTPEVLHTAVSVSGGGSATRASYGATFVTGEVTPALEMRFGDLTLYGGTHVASGRTTVSSQPTATSPVLLTSLTRSWHAPIFGAEWRLDHDASVPLVIGLRQERGRTGGETVVDRSADATLVLGRLSLGAMAGHRSSVSETADFWTGSATMMLVPGVSLQTAAGKYPSSRLTGAAPGRFLSVGLVLQSGVARALHLPGPSGVDAPSPGRVRLSIRAPEATRVEIAGDWNNWTPFPAKRAGNGVWYVDLPLAPGDYRYAFRLDGREWRVPDGAVVSDDGFGGKSAYVTVTRPPANGRTNSQEER